MGLGGDLLLIWPVGRGIIMLLEGTPGVGKTLTAEAGICILPI